MNPSLRERQSLNLRQGAGGDYEQLSLYEIPIS